VPTIGRQILPTNERQVRLLTPWTWRTAAGLERSCRVSWRQGSFWENSQRHFVASEKAGHHSTSYSLPDGRRGGNPCRL
jgi:hypothetical protein